MSDLKILEGSPLARIARMVLKSTNVAMVIGQTVHLSGVKRDRFLADAAWVAHEMEHIRQFREYGFFRFRGMYLVESWKKGYYDNRFEVEAREAALRLTGKGAKSTQQA
jgi:hypothetical protein